MSLAALRQNLRRSHGFEPLAVEGTMPEDLRGTLYRAGVGVFERFGVEVAHPFEADGAVTAVRFEGSPRGASRVVESAGWREEEQAGRRLYGAGPQMRLVFETDQEEVSVDLADYARFALPDTRIETDICVGRGDACQTFSSMQTTVRVPLNAFCDSGISLDSVTHIRLAFSSPNPVGIDGFGTLLILDDLEIRRVPGEPQVECRCG